MSKFPISLFLILILGSEQRKRIWEFPTDWHGPVRSEVTVEKKNSAKTILMFQNPQIQEKENSEIEIIVNKQTQKLIISGNNT